MQAFQSGLPGRNKVTMMINTVSGTMVPNVSPQKLSSFEMRANGFMTDLHNAISDPSSADALARKGVQDIKEGQQIASSAAQTAKSGPPSGKHHIDEWA